MLSVFTRTASQRPAVDRQDGTSMNDTRIVWSSDEGWHDGSAATVELDERGRIRARRVVDERRRLQLERSRFGPEELERIAGALADFRRRMVEEAGPGCIGSDVEAGARVAAHGIGCGRTDLRRRELEVIDASSRAMLHPRAFHGDGFDERGRFGGTCYASADDAAAGGCTFVTTLDAAALLARAHAAARGAAMVVLEGEQGYNVLELEAGARWLIGSSWLQLVRVVVR